MDASSAGGGGFGLFSIRERLRLFGASLTIKSGRGTRITVVSPLTESDFEVSP